LIILIYVWRGVQVMKLLIMQFSPISRHFIPPRSKCSPQHPVLKPALHILLTFHVPNLMFIFLCLGPLSKKSVHVRGFL
jgi:hypothetical protein